MNHPGQWGLQALMKTAKRKTLFKTRAFKDGGCELEIQISIDEAAFVIPLLYTRGTQRIKNIPGDTNYKLLQAKKNEICLM